MPPGVEVVWQTGWTDTSGLGIDAHVLMASEELSAAMRASDLVIAHAGAGSAISAMRAGHRPVLVPRQARHGEHVDDHQVQIAAELGSQGLATPLRVEDLTWEELLSRRRRVSLLSSPPAFQLTDAPVPAAEQLAPTIAGRSQSSVRSSAPSPASLWRSRVVSSPRAPSAAQICEPRKRPGGRKRSGRPQAGRARVSFVAWGAVSGRSAEIAEALGGEADASTPLGLAPVPPFSSATCCPQSGPSITWSGSGPTWSS